MAQKIARPLDVADYGEDKFERLGMLNSQEAAPLVGDFTLDGKTGTFASKPIASLDRVIDQITSGRSQDTSDGVITYSFANSNHGTGWLNHPGIPQYEGATLRGGNGYSAFSPAQEAAARLSIQMWDDLIAPSFKEVNGQGSGASDIVFANSADPAQAFAYYPASTSSKYYDGFTGDVFIADPSLNWTNAWFGTGGYGSTTLTHEIGHSIGLSHPGAYNYNPNLVLTYGNYAEYAQDSMQYTIMSYWGAENTDRYPGTTRLLIDWNTFFYHNPQTPLLHDILAIQSIYGADPTTRVGDTVYGFGSNAGLWVYDFAKNPYPYMAIYDAGGNDTIDASGFDASQFIDLHAGSFSSIGDGFADAAAVNAARAELDIVYPQTLGAISQASINSFMSSYMNVNGQLIALDTNVTGINASSHDNVSIAYGVTIENAIGGSARDLIYGNEVGNKLEGRGGNDVINGFEGNDIIIGGAGADVLTGGAGADRFVFDQLTGDTGNRITDFSADDILDFASLNIDLSYIGNSGFSGSGHAELAFVGGVLQGDFDGNGTVDFSVQLQAGATIHPDQLVLHA